MAKYRTCENCGNEFLNKVGGRPRFCKECSETTKICPICDKEFKIWRTRSSHRITCSVKCKQMWATAIRHGKGIRKQGQPAPWKHKKKSGYVFLYWPEHPMSGSRGYVAEHRIVMANKLGRVLMRHESVHHINGNKSDNSVDNLEVRIPANHPNGIGESDMAKALRGLGYIVTKTGAAGEENE